MTDGATPEAAKRPATATPVTPATEAPAAFAVSTEGTDMRCTITVTEAMTAPVFCFSLMVPPRVVSGGALLTHTGGYGEVALPDLAPGVPHEVVLAYAGDFAPQNRAWLPLGAYLRRPDGTTLPLPDLPLGVRPVAARPAPPCDGLRLVPQPDAWHPTGGACTARAFRTDAPAFVRADRLARRLRLAPLRADDGTPLVATPEDMAPGAYRLAIAPDGISIAHGDETGAFHAAVTLMTLRQTHDGALPCGRIEDSPRFGYRGQHLDCARHFFGVPTILRLLDLMALLKLNRFHWHFADDEAFRLELPGHPDLAARTALRGEGHLIPGVFGGGIEAGGSYSVQDVRTILDHAADLGIEVLPEIEVPAHALCLTLLDQGLRDPGDTGGEVCVQGYAANALNPAMPATWALLDGLAREVAGLFPMGILHLGGDELAPRTWDHSPAARALKQREGLRTRDDLQGWTMARLAGHLAGAGIRSAAWEEAARGDNRNGGTMHPSSEAAPDSGGADGADGTGGAGETYGAGGIGHDALIFSWTGQAPGIAAARKGHEVVMCPGQNVYLDMAHTAGADDWGAKWAAFIALEDTVDWQVVPEAAPDIADRIAGVQGCFWSEFTTLDSQMEAMVAPRILGVACKAWERAEATDGQSLRALAGAYGPLFDAIGWDWHRGA